MTDASASTATSMPNALSQPEIQKRLDQLLSDIHSATRRQIGYPVNQDFDYSPLAPFLEPLTKWVDKRLVDG